MSRLQNTVDDICSRLRSDNWSIRLKSLEDLQEVVRNDPQRGSGWSDVLLQKLAKHLESQLRELRSAIVREACKVLETFSQCTGDMTSHLSYLLYPKYNSLFVPRLIFLKMFF